MAWFGYEGMTPGASAISGSLEADSRETAERLLARMQIEVRALREITPPRAEEASLGAEDLLFFNEQLASLAEAGIALDEGLQQLARDVSSPRFRRWIDGLVADLKQGVAIDEAIARRERGLPLLYSQVVRAGIQSGDLPATLMNLNQHLRLVGTTKRLIWEAMAYPLIVVFLALGVVSMFIIGVVPKFEEILFDFGTEVPVLTRVLFQAAHVFPMLLLVGVGILIALIAIWQSLRLTRGGRRIRDGILMHVPMVGGLVKASVLARFMRGVATAIASRLPLPEAIRLASSATGSEVLRRDADVLAADVEKGQSVYQSCRKLALIPPIFGFCVETAMGRGSLPHALGQLARAYEQRALHSQSMIRALLFPLMLIVVGVLLGMFIVALFLPLIRVINSVAIGV
jgi:type II secretory pathway component PulF